MCGSEGQKWNLFQEGVTQAEGGKVRHLRPPVQRPLSSDTGLQTCTAPAAAPLPPLSSPCSPRLLLAQLTRGGGEASVKAGIWSWTSACSSRRSAIWNPCSWPLSYLQCRDNFYGSAVSAPRREGAGLVPPGGCCLLGGSCSEAARSPCSSEV